MEERPPGKRSGRGRRQAGAKTVLVVNDHLEIRGVLTEFLRGLGFIAIPVRDAESARVIAERVSLDLILLNLLVLDINATALIRQLKVLRPGATIIVISGFTTPELEKECRALGADEVLQKPINLKNLERLIFRLLRSRKPSPQ
jgi:DNA-binding response OmpR family regulator